MYCCASADTAAALIVPDEVRARSAGPAAGY